MRRTRAGLRLHRETLRHLGARDLVGVAGGTDAAQGGDSTGDDPRPKTNAWTGGVADGFVYANELCLVR